MEKLILILTGLTVVTGLIKIFWNYLYLKLMNTIKKAGRPYKERNADEIIKKHYRIECNKEDLEAVKNSFTSLYRNKKLKRQEILKIKHWIQKNVKYPKKDFNNDINEIYSALKHGRWDAYDIKVLEDYLMKEKLYTIKSYTLFYIKNIAKLTAYTLAIVSLYLSSFIVNNEILKAAMGLSIIYLLIPGLVSAYYKYGYIEAACKYYRHKKIS